MKKLSISCMMLCCNCIQNILFTCKKNKIFIIFTIYIYISINNNLNKSTEFTGEYFEKTGKKIFAYSKGMTSKRLVEKKMFRRFCSNLV